MTATNAMLFEGSNLEEVLAEAKLCFGPDIEIEAANRVRKGGVMGFFATEWYEVWVKPPASRVAAIRQLERQDDADSFQHMVENALAERHVAAEPTPDDYQDALDRFFGPDAGGTGRVADRVGPAPRAGAGAPAAVPTARGTSRAPANGATATLERPAAAAEMPATATSDPSADVAPAPAPAATAAPTRRITPAVDVVLDAAPAAVALEDAPRGASVFTPEKAPKPELLWAMLERLDSVRPAPALPSADGSLVAFVGPAAATLETARRIAATTQDRWTGDVAVLSRRARIDGVEDWLLVNDLDEVLTRARRWRQRPGLVAVVIDMDLDVVGDRKWAIEALTTLEAAQVRLIAEAWRLPEDVGRASSKLGGVDAIDLIDTTDAIEPLAMLDLDLPVGTVEGRAASAELLAAVWLEKRRAG